MLDFDSTFERLNSEPPSRELQMAVLDMVSAALDEAGERFGYWEKECIAQALISLAQNVCDPGPPHDRGLRLALVNAEKALCPPEERDESYGRKDEAIGALSFDELRSDIERLRAAI